MSGYVYRRYRYRKAGGRDQAIGAAVAAVIVLALATGKAPGAHGAHAAAGIAPATASGSTLSCAGLEALWESVGGSRGTAFMAAEIAMAESSGRQHATLHNTNGTTDRGFWQINSVHGALSTYDPAGNARAAVLISRGGTDWTAWVTYNTRAYAGRC
jgi:lysozyme-like protein